ncbi:hypothetical protein RYX45_01570 [Alkalihalophilus pseudofirmus]|uniref:Uncharacterized protein n=1 Tax=Alkalihalophilus pseudofirmus TaxID=79885 RepID=A0AAJ2NJY0_ALKPS|nr:hypothetical protein [Alkalihalophilus pseudofirmus]MDV2883852.1 hypothetical protein [Alkalihalophilus pseudofirmus]
MQVKEYKPSSYNLDAYPILFELENHMRDTIFLNKKYYDPKDIPHVMTFSMLYLQLQKQYSKGNRAFSHLMLAFIEKSLPIRNKVCHMEEITEDEFDTLELCLKLVRIGIKNRDYKFNK